MVDSGGSRWGWFSNMMFSDDLADELHQPIAKSTPSPSRPPPAPLRQKAGGLEAERPRRARSPVRRSDGKRSYPNEPSPRRKQMEQALETLKNANSRAMSPLRVPKSTPILPPPLANITPRASSEEKDVPAMSRMIPNHPKPDSLAATLSRRKDALSPEEPLIHIRENPEYTPVSTKTIEQKRERDLRRERRRQKKLQDSSNHASNHNGRGRRLSKEQAKMKMQLMMKKPDLWMKFKQRLAEQENASNHEVVRTVLEDFVKEHEVELGRAELSEQEELLEQERKFQEQFQEHNKRKSIFESAFGSLDEEMTTSMTASSVTEPSAPAKIMTAKATPEPPRQQSPRLSLSRGMSARNVIDAFNNSLRIESEMLPTPSKKVSYQEAPKARHPNQEKKHLPPTSLPPQAPVESRANNLSVASKPGLPPNPPTRSGAKQQQTTMPATVFSVFSPVNVRGAISALAGEMEPWHGASVNSPPSPPFPPSGSVAATTIPKINPSGDNRLPPAPLLSASHFSNNELHEISLSSNENSFSILLKDSDHRSLTDPSFSPLQPQDSSRGVVAGGGGGFVQKLKRVSMDIFSHELEFCAKECEATLDGLSTLRQAQINKKRASLNDSLASAFSMDEPAFQNQQNLGQNSTLYHESYSSQFVAIEEDDEPFIIRQQQQPEQLEDLEESDGDMFARAAAIAARHALEPMPSKTPPLPPRNCAIAGSPEKQDEEDQPQASVQDSEIDDDELRIRRMRHYDDTTTAEITSGLNMDGTIGSTTNGAPAVVEETKDVEDVNDEDVNDEDEALGASAVSLAVTAKNVEIDVVPVDKDEANVPAHQLQRGLDSHSDSKQEVPNCAQVDGLEEDDDLL